MRYETMIEALEVNGRRLIEVGSRGLFQRVPTCPGWDVTRLLTHVAHIYDWATRSLAADPGDHVRKGAMAEAPIDPEQCTDALDALVCALQATDSLARRAGPLEPRMASWWARRQLLETVVHRWDAENALGTPAEIEPEIATLGVVEFVEVFAGGTAIPVKIRATDAELLLVLWGRTDLDNTRVDGDPEQYRSWRAAIST